MVSYGMILVCYICICVFCVGVPLCCFVFCKMSKNECLRFMHDYNLDRKKGIKQK